MKTSSIKVPLSDLETFIFNTVKVAFNNDDCSNIEVCCSYVLRYLKHLPNQSKDRLSYLIEQETSKSHCGKLHKEALEYVIKELRK